MIEPAGLDPNEEKKRSQEKITEPIIIWWTPFTGERGSYRKCGNVKCFFTVNRHYMNNPQTKVHILYKFCLFLGCKFKHFWGLFFYIISLSDYLYKTITSHVDNLSGVYVLWDRL